MISKKWRKLDKQLLDKNEKSNDIDYEKEDDNDKKEILIVDMNNNAEEEEIEKNNEKENVIKNIKENYKLSKPKPILNVDLNSINLVNYKVNKNNCSYQRYNNYYRGYDLPYHYQPRNYTNYNTSHFNIRSNTNSHINNLAKSNEYTYNFSSPINNRNNPYLIKNLNNRNEKYQPYNKLNKNNISFLEYLVSNNKVNKYYNLYTNNLKNKNNLTYSYNLEGNLTNLRKINSRRYLENENNLLKDDLLNKNIYNSNLSNIRRINRSYSGMNFYPGNERETYIINNNKYKLQPTILTEKNRYKKDNSIDSQLHFVYI